MLWESFENVALVFEPLERIRKGCAKFVNRLQRVVEGDNGTIARVPLYIISDIFCRQPFGIVAGDKIPHHDLELAA